jgi:predicted CXXCH cytochrome family protein
MKKANASLEGLRSLLLRYKRLNLIILALVAATAVIVLAVVLLREPIEWSLNPSKKCLTCHKAQTAKYIHSPYAKGQCLSCHTSHKKGEKSKLKAPLKQLCLTCHGSIGKDISLHFAHVPAQKGRCLECHKNHVSNHKNLLVKSPDDLCVECHRIAEELAKSDTHEPFEKRQCLSCHVAHGSPFDKGLRNSQKDLCVLCHVDIAQAEANAFQHLPFEDGRCTDCHGAHATDYSFQLLDQRPDLCYDCHPDIEKFFKKASHHPEKRDDFNCSNCHNPHSEDYRYLLAAGGKNFCFICHQDKKNFYLTCAHNQILATGGIGDCLGCHVVHGADYASLLPEDSVSVCFNCHQQIEDAVHNHPVADGHIDTLAKKRLTCSSTCHNPHGTGKNYMVTWYPDELCLKCHQKKELP